MSGLVSPDDVAVLELAEPLTASAAVRPISLIAPTGTPLEGAQVILTGFGEQNPNKPESPDGNLYSLHMALDFSRECGGEADALFVCASVPTGTACHGDSGSGLTDAGSTPTLVGVTDVIEIFEGAHCPAGTVDGFANVAAPEIQDFIDGDEKPPLAPRGGGAIIRGVTTVGNSLSCEPGGWTNSPTFTYTFIDTVNGQPLQTSGSSTYPLSAADVGRIILCQVQATNAGGTGIGRTPALAPVQAAPVVLPPAQSIGSAPISTPTESSSMALASTRITVKRNGVALVKLHCSGRKTCRGKLALTAKRTVRVKGKKTLRTVAIGAVGFSIAGEGTATVKIRLGAVGRRLLGAGHRSLSARLAILRLEPAPAQTQIKGVRLLLKAGRK